MKVIMERFNQFNQLYRYDDNFGWVRRHTTGDLTVGERMLASTVGQAVCCAA